MKQKLKKVVSRLRRNNEREGLPRITNDTVAAHREEVLSSARKYIYPLQHSKHRIVLISTGVIIASLVVFTTYCVLALYRVQSTAGFLYRVTQVVPFPVAKAGPSLVAYENYLFEIRHYKYFYEHQQKLDFNTEAGKRQLADYQKKALDKVINDAYIKQLAKANHLSVSSREVDDAITILNRQNRLGGSEQAYEDALKQNFDWTTSDFKRVIRQSLLEQKVVSALDQDTHHRAEAALSEVQSGADFAAVAAKYTDDPAGKTTGGDFGFPVDRTNRDISPITTDALFKLKPGQTSQIINTGYSLEILKCLEVNGDKIKAQHILFNFKDIDSFINQRKDQHKARAFIRL
jgi:parvulin-like peptidyl-prolyl isomerase